MHRRRRRGDGGVTSELLEGEVQVLRRVAAALLARWQPSHTVADDPSKDLDALPRRIAYHSRRRDPDHRILDVDTHAVLHAKERVGLLLDSPTGVMAAHRPLPKEAWEAARAAGGRAAVWHTES